MSTVKAEDGEHPSATKENPKIEEPAKMNGVIPKKERRSESSTPAGSHINSRASSVSHDDVKVGSDSASTPSNSSAPRLSRKASQKNVKLTARVFDHLPDATTESCLTFQVINDCLYGSKHMGSSEHDALDCDCTEEWRDGKNYACGEESDCINRATKMECVDRDCNCGDGCENQRFQQKQYADVSVIKTEKKGFGLRANTDLEANDFIFEYIGEVINEPTFRRRMLQYDDEGIKHFYFMSLTKSEFVDATKKGNLGRFCNHSCNPNCYVDKWVVGEKLRMGIFAGRRVKAGEELVFNYNVDRYGADPQPCYCGEPNCTGYIGGKTQTERATKLPVATIEALGIDDGDTWDTAIAKRPRKKKPTEDDEEYVNSVQPRGLSEDGVTKVMAALMQCKEKWIVVKLLLRIQHADDDRVRHRVVRMHGYQILKTTLTTFVEDTNVVLQILDILYKLPRLTKNKISDSKIEATIDELTSSEHQDVSFESKRLLSEWSKLETAYRIPRKKVDPNAPAANSFEERRNMDREEDAPKPDPFANIVIPKGPRSNVPQRNASFFNGPRAPRKPPTHNLPAGWFIATDKSGAYYYYNKSGMTTWQRPTAPANEGPKGPSKAQENQKALQDIIDRLTKEPTPKPSASQTPQQQVTTPVQEPKKEKWRSLPIEKQMKIYENTLFPHVKYVMDKFHKKLPREELKKFAREINKKLVASDYKNNRVLDPTSITPRQEKNIRVYVTDFFHRAVKKFQDREKTKAERASRRAARDSKDQNPEAAGPSIETPTQDEIGGIDEAAMSDVEETISPSSSLAELKRKRDEDNELGSNGQLTPSETPSAKRLKEDDADADAPSPPPPPPPPPADVIDAPMTEEERSMREQEEALMRENEEAQRLEDEAEASKMKVDGSDPTRGDEETAPALEPESKQLNGQRFESNNGLDDYPANGAGNGSDLDGHGSAGEGSSLDHGKARKQEVLSH